MVDKVDTATVTLWGEEVGAVSWLESRGYAVFEYSPSFLKSGLNISPVHMGVDAVRKTGGMFQFPELGRRTFYGLPGLLADSLPDKFGNAVIDAWLARNGRDAASFSPVERLCYMGSRGMGALEYKPAINGSQLDKAVPVNIAGLAELAQEILQKKSGLETKLGDGDAERAEAMRDILRVGTSAGGARPKAVIAMNAEGKVLSGQAGVPDGYEHWILKFDGVTDTELGKTSGFGRIEYAYHLMAKAAGLNMTECRLLEENGRAHFMTRRFDRAGGNGKLHMQSLCGLAHYDFNMAGAYGYEQVFMVMRKMGVSKADALQQYRRMLFNILARNQDDHTKNVAFLMGQDGRWSLAPTFDVTYSHNPHGQWTNLHQMSAAGKRDGFTRDELVGVGESNGLPRAAEVFDEVLDAVAGWHRFAKEVGVQQGHIDDIQANLRIDWRDEKVLSTPKM